MDDDPDPTALFKQPLFWLMVAVGLALGIPAGYFFAQQMAG
jgi:hypothetical protein